MVPQGYLRQSRRPVIKQIIKLPIKLPIKLLVINIKHRKGP
jgi:hypothetical protein